jgi:hypothetical protein
LPVVDPVRTVPRQWATANTGPVSHTWAITNSRSITDAGSRSLPRGRQRPRSSRTATQEFGRRTASHSASDASRYGAGQITRPCGW